MFYTNCYQYGQSFLLRGYKNGKRFNIKQKIKPYLFVPSKKEDAEYTDIHKNPFDKVKFDSLKDYREFLDNYKDVSNFQICGYDRVTYPFLNDNFSKCKFIPEEITVCNFDIEVYNKDNQFPDIEKADDPVVAITAFYGKFKYCYGLKPHDPADKSVKYIHCANEKELLLAFLRDYKHHDPDVLTGWYIEFFDITYLYRRMIAILGPTDAIKLSPWGIVSERTTNIRGKDQTTFKLAGISVLDYQQLYKKFTQNQLESYSLNYVCHHELGEKKLDYDDYESLTDLYNKNPSLYLDYNIRDVDLIDRLDEKMNLINLVFVMSYDACINFEDSFGSVLPWEILIHNYLMQRKIVVPFRKYSSQDREFPGGYVKDPVVGLHSWVVSFDLTSLYPHLIMEYNISPETFVEKLEGITPDAILSNTPLPTREGFSLAGNGCVYDNGREGFLPALMKEKFLTRKAYKKKMFDAEKEGNKIESSKNDVAQMAMKILLNSAYGAIGNQYFMFYSTDNAEAITLSGQLSVRWAADAVNAWMNELLKTEDIDYIIASDTDSIYITMEKLINKMKLVEKEKTVRFLDKFCEEKVSPVINAAYDRLAQRTCAFTNAMNMDREVIADAAIWTAKKRYCMNVLNSEGISYDPPKLKVMGNEAVRSTIPEICRIALKDSMRIMMNEDNPALIKFIKEFKEKFMKAPLEEIALTSTANNLTKYGDRHTIYKFKTPMHTKGCLLYNDLIKKKGLTTISPIYEKEKIKFINLKIPNPLHENVISFPGMLPKELGLEKYLDKEKQFTKAFLAPITMIADCIGWDVKKMNRLEI